MANYNSPGVFIQDQVKSQTTVLQSTSSVGVLIGKTRSGVVNTAQRVTSWTEFISKYANGLDTPFSNDSYLAYAVYGFFQNGGRELYVGSVKNGGVAASGEGSVITARAKYAGVWGNDIRIAITKNKYWRAATEGDTGNLSFDVTVSIGSSDKVTILDCTISDIVSKVMADASVPNWLGEFALKTGVTALSEETITLANGSDGTALTDSDYINALSMIDFLDNVTFVGIPGQTSAVVNSALMSYCEENGLFPFLDTPVGSTVEDVKNYRKSINSFTGALCYPWGAMYDPVTNDNKFVPTCGHVMGVYARTIEDRGVYKVPAGVDAVLRGFTGLETRLTQADISLLNPTGVVCLVSKPNIGVVVWGARSLNSSDDAMRYVSDGLLNLTIKKSLHNNTQFATFEPNTEDLRNRLDTVCRAYLESLYVKGAFKGSTSDEAYYVIVDGSNNTDETIAQGLLNIEIGYAPIKPAEFIVIKLAHSIESN